MKKIAYECPPGSVLKLITPCEGSRLATAIRDAKGNELARSERPIPVEQFRRGWPIDGITAEWAESEAEFVQRIAAADVEVLLTETPSEIRAKLGGFIKSADPAPATLPRKAALRFGISFNETTIQIVDPATIPADRAFRNAWKVGTGAIGIDMPRAREIHRANLRSMRATKFTELDVAYMRADEAGDAALKATIAAQKQALRDAPNDPAIELAKTPEELKIAIPALLRP